MLIDKDGNVDSCGKHDEAVSFEFGGDNTSGGSNMGSGDIAFISNGYVLKGDGTV